MYDNELPPFGDFRGELFTRNEQSELTKTSISDYPDIFTLICKIEGYKTKLKELHWGAINHPAHKVIDEVLSLVSDFQDEIAEDAQGFLGKVKIGTFHSIPCSCTCTCEVLDYLLKDTLTLRSKYKEDMNYVGIINEIEGLAHAIQQHKYLMKLAEVV